MKRDMRNVKRATCNVQRSARVHLMGVCGVGMAGVAWLLKARGFSVTGCDLSTNRITEWLASNGVECARGHDPSHINDSVDWIIRSAAVPEDSPEVCAAIAKGIPVFKRGEVLPLLLNGRVSVAVGGTHGKTSTSTFITQILKSAGRCPSWCIGAENDALGGVAGGGEKTEILKVEKLKCERSASNRGSGDQRPLVVEADESDGTLTLYHPEIGVVTNVEFDHMEHFESEQDFFGVFARFISQCRQRVWFCADDEQAAELCRDVDYARGYGFGEGAYLKAEILKAEKLKCERSTSNGGSGELRVANGELRECSISNNQHSTFDIQGENEEGQSPSTIDQSPVTSDQSPETRDQVFMRVFREEELLGELRVTVPGHHNALNLLGAIGVCLDLGVSFEEIAAAMGSIVLPKRRFEIISERDGIRIVSDYAHHPSEIAALVRTARSGEWGVDGGEGTVESGKGSMSNNQHSISSRPTGDRVFVFGKQQSGNLQGENDQRPSTRDQRPETRAPRPATRGRLVAVFQPHRYSRTLALGADFPAAFEGVDLLVLLPVYAASEKPIAGGRVCDLYERFRDDAMGGLTPLPLVASSLEEAWAFLRGELRRGDTLLIVGAGDVEKIAEWAGEGEKAEILKDEHRTSNIEHSTSNDLRLLTGDQGLTTICENENIGRFTTYGLGGAADWFVRVGDVAEWSEVLRVCNERGIPFRVLGGGSNVLVSDLGVRGVVARLTGDIFRGIRRDGDQVVVGAAVSVARLLDWVEGESLGGVEFLEGIPGQIGGVVRMNAGAYGHEICERVLWIRGLKNDGSECRLIGSELDWEYRGCPQLDDLVVVEVCLRLDSCESGLIASARARIGDLRGWQRGLRCSGSVFRNPPGMSAGKLIDDLGLKGCRIGGAYVSCSHANMIVADKGATASDVMALIQRVEAKVLDGCGVALELEVIVWGGELGARGFGEIKRTSNIQHRTSNIE